MSHVVNYIAIYATLVIMFNFARLFTVRILSMFLAGIGSILLITHSSPPPSIVISGEPGFSACHLPCWAGITPHETVFKEALRNINASLPGWSLDVQRNNTQITFYGNHGENQIAGVIYEDRTFVGRIRLDVAMPVGYLIEELGRPYCVRTNYLSTLNENVVVVYWRLADATVMGIIRLDPLEDWYPGALTETLLVLTSNEECTLIDALPWVGFARLWLYQTDFTD